MPETATLPTAGNQMEQFTALAALDERIAELIADRLMLARRLAETDAALPPAGDRAARLSERHGLDQNFLTDLFEIIDAEARRGTATESGQSVLNRTAVRIDHVAIAVHDLESAIAHLHESFGFEVMERRSVAGQISGMETATLRAGMATIVLCQGTSPASGVSRYIEHYGPGVQHVAIAVRDQEHLLADLHGRGADLLTGIIHAPGLDQSFTRRESNTGMQWEFITRTDPDSPDGFDDGNVRELFTAMERENAF